MIVVFDTNTIASAVFWPASTARQCLAASPPQTQSCPVTETTYRRVVIESTAANVAQHFAEMLAKVERGETVRIQRQGRIVARLVPDCDFMPGQRAADLFKEHRADSATANAIAHELRKLDSEAEHALDH